MHRDFCAAALSARRQGIKIIYAFIVFHAARSHGNRVMQHRHKSSDQWDARSVMPKPFVVDCPIQKTRKRLLS